MFTLAQCQQVEQVLQSEALQGKCLWHAQQFKQVHAYKIGIRTDPYAAMCSQCLSVLDSTLATPSRPLREAAPKRELTEEEQIYVNSGGRSWMGMNGRRLV